MFTDRIDAGLQLAGALAAYRGSDALLLAIPRGGVPVAAVAARELGLPVDILPTKKIGHPVQPELAIGAVSLHGTLVDPRYDVPKSYILRQERTIRDLLGERAERYREGRPPEPIAGRPAVLVDDGIATGHTMRAAIEVVRLAKASKVVVAVPVAAWGTVQGLAAWADEVICLETPVDLHAVGMHYGDFTQVDDEDVVAWLREAQRPANVPGGSA